MRIFRRQVVPGSCSLVNSVCPSLSFFFLVVLMLSVLQPIIVPSAISGHVFSLCSHRSFAICHIWVLVGCLQDASTWSIVSSSSHTLQKHHSSRSWMFN